MRNNIYVMERSSAEPLSVLADRLSDSLCNSRGILGGAEPVLCKITPLGEAEVALLIFEKLYFRNGSYSNLTVEITSCNYIQRATVIGSGGGEGLLNISWGANSDFAGRACEYLQELGFRDAD